MSRRYRHRSSTIICRVRDVQIDIRIDRDRGRRTRLSRPVREVARRDSAIASRGREIAVVALPDYHRRRRARAERRRVFDHAIVVGIGHPQIAERSTSIPPARIMSRARRLRPPVTQSVKSACPSANVAYCVPEAVHQLRMTHIIDRSATNRVPPASSRRRPDLHIA